MRPAYADSELTTCQRSGICLIYSVLSTCQGHGECTVGHNLKHNSTQGKYGSLTLQPETLTDLVSLERLELVQPPLSVLHVAWCESSFPDALHSQCDRSYAKHRVAYPHLCIFSAVQACFNL